MQHTHMYSALILTHLAFSTASHTLSKKKRSKNGKNKINNIFLLQQLNRAVANIG